MQPHAGLVGQGDRGDRLGEALRFQHRQQRPVEQGADAAPWALVGDVDGGLDREAIGGPRPEGAGIGIAERPPVVLEATSQG